MLRIRNKVVGIVVSCIMMFFIFRYFALVSVSTADVLSSIIYPFLRIQQVIVEPLKIWLDNRGSIRDFNNEIKCLQKQRDELIAENNALRAMHYYADDIKELRNFNKRYLLERGRIGHVLARHFSSNNQFFLINAGTRDGIKKDMVALCNNCLVGKVSEVYPWYCKVVLVTDAECKIAAVCPETGVSGIHEGINANTYTVLQHVSHLKKVALKSTIFSSGQGLIFPGGFALGTIESADKGELFYSIIIKPLLDFQTISHCVLVGKDEIEVM